MTILKFLKTPYKLPDNLLITSNLSEVFDEIKKFNGQVALVGGFVRSVILNEKINYRKISIDIATNLKPNQIIKIFGSKAKYIDEGLKHGTVIVNNNGLICEITTLRSDVLTKGRYADVEFVDHWFMDASRRDLTINAIYMDLEGNIFDPLNGSNDLVNGKIKFIGKMTDRLNEDFLRLLRFIRFFSKYSKNKIKKEQLDILKKFSKKINLLSKERVIEELKKIFSENKCISLISAELMSKTNMDKNYFGFKFSLIKLEVLKNFNFNVNWIKKILLLYHKEKNLDFIKNNPISSDERKLIDNFNIKLTKEEISNLLSDKWCSTLYYLKGPVYLKLLIEVKFSLKIQNRINQIKNFKKPMFPIKGEDILRIGLHEGPEIGLILKKIEKKWVNSDFSFSRQELLDELILDLN